MGNVADSFAIKILIGIATAAVWFALSRAANAEEKPVGPVAPLSAAEMCPQLCTIAR